ncbi:hypothetical protein HQ560_08570 [bacterium]|nr:hypothetical protein [bacterium]
MRTILRTLAVLSVACLLASCALQSHPTLYREARDSAQNVFDRHWTPYQPEYLDALEAAKAVLARHYMVTGVDKAHGVVYAQSAVGANISTKYRTVAVGRVRRISDGQYDVGIRVKNELEVSTPSLMGGGDTPHDWRTVAYDQIREAELMNEVNAELAGYHVTSRVRSNYVLWGRPEARPTARHRDLFQPPPAAPPVGKPAAPLVPEGKAEPPAAKPQTHAPPATRNDELYRRYMAQGDVYLKSAQRGQDTVRKALIEYQRATIAKPHSPSPHLSLAATWTALKDYPRAAESLRQAAARSDGGAMSKQDLARLRTMGDETRVMLLKGWCKQNPDDRDARLVLGYQCLLVNRAKDAQENLDELLATNPSDTVAAYLVRQL